MPNQKTVLSLSNMTQSLANSDTRDPPENRILNSLHHWIASMSEKLVLKFEGAQVHPTGLMKG